MKNTIQAPGLIIYAKLSEATLDAEGNIHLIISKDKIQSAETTTKKLRRLVDSDITLQVMPFYKKEETIVQTKDVQEQTTSDVIQSINL